jgi:hypothetical protein
MFIVDAHYRIDMLFLSVPTDGVNIMASMQRYTELAQQRISTILGGHVEYLSVRPGHMEDMRFGLRVHPAHEARGHDIVAEKMPVIRECLREIKDSRQWIVRLAA